MVCCWPPLFLLFGHSLLRTCHGNELEGLAQAQPPLSPRVEAGDDSSVAGGGGGQAAGVGGSADWADPGRSCADLSLSVPPWPYCHGAGHMRSKMEVVADPLDSPPITSIDKTQEMTRSAIVSSGIDPLLFMLTRYDFPVTEHWDNCHVSFAVTSNN